MQLVHIIVRLSSQTLLPQAAVGEIDYDVLLTARGGKCPDASSI